MIPDNTITEELTPQIVVHEYILLGNKKGWKIRLDSGMVSFTDGRLTLTGEFGGVLAQQLDALLRVKPYLNAAIRKVDRAAALAAAQEHFNAAAVKGGMTSESVSRARRAAIAASKQAELESAPNNPEALAELEAAEQALNQGDFLRTEVNPAALNTPGPLTLRRPAS